ncbi:hypothetical protein EGW08_021754 [Elysia chlorotica]|uniref:Uncharacterized protein n=1 Tax=Elysia chlorotica TaxID=188477 RepID=A0A433SMQ2_ELYCH|nr:hypothetical protein EGW08_021754 [Elysia chlorotica]
MLTTAHDAVIESRVIKGKERTKPLAIFDYNQYMGGVDISDKQVVEWFKHLYPDLDLGDDRLRKTIYCTAERAQKIVLRWNHNQKLNSTEALCYGDVGESTRQRCLELFSLGHINSTYDVLRCELEMIHGENCLEALADRKLLPDKEALCYGDVGESTRQRCLELFSLGHINSTYDVLRCELQMIHGENCLEALADRKLLPDKGSSKPGSKNGESTMSPGDLTKAYRWGLSSKGHDSGRQTVSVVDPPGLEGRLTAGFNGS